MLVVYLGSAFVSAESALCVVASWLGSGAMGTGWWCSVLTVLFTLLGRYVGLVVCVVSACVLSAGLRRESVTTLCFSGLPRLVVSWLVARLPTYAFVLFLRCVIYLRVRPTQLLTVAFLP